MSTDLFRHTRRREVKSRMWAGSTDDFQKLLDVVSDVQEQARERTRARYASEEEPGERADFERMYTFLDEGPKRDEAWNRLRSRTLGSRLERVNVTVEMRMKRDEETLFGSPAKVMSNLDSPASVREAEIRLGDFVGYGMPPTENGFRIAFDGFGGKATVYGIDDDWVTVTEAKLSKALARRRPRYAYLRGSVVSWLLAFVASAIVLGALNIGRIVDLAPNAPFNPVLFALQAVMTGVVYALIGFAFRTGIPRFELYEVGDKPRGGRAARTVFAVLGVILTAIIIPIALHAMGIV